MHSTTQRLAFISLLIALVGAAYAVDYMYVSDYEHTVFGDHIRFWHGDTLAGPVHSNDQIGIMGDPVFYDRVTQAGPWDDFEHGDGYNPQFLNGPPPIFHARPVHIPEQLCYFRERANHYYNPGVDKQMRCVITSTEVILYTWDKGVPFEYGDPHISDWFHLDSSEEIIFTETPLELMGTDITGDVTICSAMLIRLMDDVRVGGPTSGPPQYRVLQNNPNYVTIASEGDIKIANTWANGRENSSGAGNAQSNPSLTDIVITAALYALGNPSTGFVGSFTFENQNDLDSGYVCQCAPDDRGQIFLYGAIAQRRRGYVHRANNSSTGYLKQYIWDERLRTRPELVVGDLFDDLTTDTLFFGDVPVDSTVWDTAHIRFICPGELGVPMASEPYTAVRVPPFYGTDLRIPVSFTPPHVGNFPGMLQVQTSYRLFQIPLRGTGIPGGSPQGTGPDSLIAHLTSLITFPNPFNATTSLTFEVTTAGQATLELFDITGRCVMTLLDGQIEPGTQRVTINGESLPSGLYFARLQTPDQVKTLKLMLVK